VVDNDLYYDPYDVEIDADPYRRGDLVIWDTPACCTARCRSSRNRVA
jgi:hypothetical protein